MFYILFCPAAPASHLVSRIPLSLWSLKMVRLLLHRSKFWLQPPIPPFMQTDPWPLGHQPELITVNTCFWTLIRYIKPIILALLCILCLLSSRLSLSDAWMLIKSLLMFICLHDFPECCGVFNTCTCTGPLRVHPALPSAPASKLQCPGLYQRRTHMAGWALNRCTLLSFCFSTTNICFINGHSLFSRPRQCILLSPWLWLSKCCYVREPDYPGCDGPRAHPDPACSRQEDIVAGECHFIKGYLNSLFKNGNNNDTSTLSCVCVLGLCASGARKHLPLQLFVWGASGQILRLHQQLWTKQLLYQVWHF